jgi:hypothetical protein
MRPGIRRLFIALLICCPALLSSFRFDAPAEQFLVPAEKIHPKALQEVRGVLTVTFAELDYYIDIKMEPAKLLTYKYTDTTGHQATRFFLTIENTKALSGIDYSGVIIRRFPIVQYGDSFVQIIYNVEKNLRAWIQVVDNKYARTSVGQLVPASSMLFTPGKNLSYSFDVFYLLKGKKRIFYQTPNETSATIPVSSDQDFDIIPWRERKENVSSFTITEMENGFAKVNTQSGADGELLFAGWVKIFVGGKLTVWEFETRGC